MYEVSKALYRLNEPDERQAFLTDPDAYVRGLSQLSRREQDLIRNHDARGLLDLGVSIYLIRTLEIIGQRTLVDTGLRTGGEYPRIVRDDG